ncbi:MAG: hypothetical protein M1823_000970 [Watsoniomyces obsoletus]|nr:MAG: hypothetical protein M1823_000970 [Watsoniomyces obsoletus]
MAQDQDPRPVFFFDIDNCVSFTLDARVLDLMKDKIDEYFVEHLSLSPADAEQLHQTYYLQYGLAIEGLVRHHKIDPIEYNRAVDDALPLEKCLSPDPQLRKLLKDFDRSKVRLWLLTNAYVNHARRVLKLLQVDDLFEGMTFCDYGAEKIICKPHKEMYDKAMREAGVTSSDQCYFVDDSFVNCNKAHDLGWTTVHRLEPDDPEPAVKASQYQVRSLEELRELFPQFFKTHEIKN